MQPVIGITGRPKELESVGQPTRGYTVFHTYTDAVIAAGGSPVVLIPTDVDHIDDVLDRIDGVLLTGGGDIDPERYGGAPHESLMGVDEERDAYELELARLAYARRIPTLAICRGLQVVNVAFGGTLVRDLPSERGVEGHDRIGDAAWEKHSSVEIDPASTLAEVIGPGTHGINSIHHQAVDRVGDGIRVVGRAPEGTPEAIQHEDATWPMLAVQWHPEFLRCRGDGASIELFGHLVGAAAKYRADQ
ncbi:MAG: gamma-glutamyl-gamma-aminobutyrate hydrolase family protein [Acidimicrobiia bacterium]|nr:gamma-glutamyl-gamma-aminobutyrate hydrolase family protein [Acidimicrobiia bacterium]